MRNNPVKKKLLAGQPVFGTFGWEFLVPGLPQIVKAADAEFLMMDMGTTADLETIKSQVAECRGIDLVPMARVATSQYQYISRALDIGCMGIMVPMVGSAEEAKFIVSCTRYPPAGRRGAAFGFAADDYIGGSVADKIRVANARTLVMCLIETEEGIRNVEQIAAVPGGCAVAGALRPHQFLASRRSSTTRSTRPRSTSSPPRLASTARCSPV
jgi:2-keto-3-deoxy-L-rhamnonate aldolase RhmA